MYLTVQAKSMRVTEGLREKVQSYLPRVDKLQTNIQRVRVFLEAIPHSRDVSRAAIAHVEFALPGKLISVTHKAPDAYAAIHAGMLRAIQVMARVKKQKRQK